MKKTVTKGLFFALSLGLVLGLASDIYAANDVTTTAGASLVLPSDSSSYTLGTNTTVQSFTINNSSFDFVVEASSVINLTSANRKDFTVTNSGQCGIVQTCGASASIVTVTCPSGIAERTITITPNGLCASSGGVSTGGTSGGTPAAPSTPVVTPTPTVTPAAATTPAALPSGLSVSLSVGDVIRGASTKDVFYVASDGKRYTFPTDKVFFSWYKNWSSVKTVPDADLAKFSVGGSVSYRPGTQLIKIQTDPKVYAVEAGGVLRWVETGEVAKALWGKDWAKRVHDVDPSIFPYIYKISASTIKTITYPVGSLVKMGANYYLIGLGLTKQKVTTEGLTANMLQTELAVTATDLSAYVNGIDVTSKDSSLVNVVEFK